MLQFLLAAMTALAACPPPAAPQAYLDVVQKPRAVTSSVGSLERTRMFNLITRKNDIPNIFSSCRMAPVTLTGEDPITHQPRPVQLTDYSRKGSQPSQLPTVLLLPPTGGENALDDAYADHLCNHGFLVVLVQHWTDDTAFSSDLGMHDRGTMRMSAAINDVVTYINPKPQQLGILGTSVGAISAALTLGVQSRISTGVLIVGGGGMSEIIGRSDEKTLAGLREKRMSSLQLHTQDDYVTALSRSVKIEPLDFIACGAHGKNVLTFLATADKTVPTANQWKLYHAFGDQEIETWDADHFHTILHTAWAKKTRITDYFAKHLRAAAATLPASDQPN